MKEFNVLSLFDGISCGQVALQKAGIPYTKYYASEIDDRAIRITQKNFPKTIQYGSVTKIKKEHFMSPIHFLIGGSPCQGFSFAGKQLRFDDPRSKLFFEFVRLKNELKPKYFFLENVRMDKKCQDIITKYLGVEAITICSSKHSAQARKRHYWTNIPYANTINEIYLQDILQHGFAHRKKSKCIRVGGLMSKDKHEWDIADTTGRTYTLVEIERLQGLPDNYTQGISKAARYKSLGNAWQIDTILQFFINIIP